MSDKRSLKQQRRQAARREMARRSRIREEQLQQAAGDVDWGTAATLAPTIRENLVRLGAAVRGPTSSDPIQILVHEINWPADQVYQGSTERLREIMLDLGHTDYEWMDETELEDEMPHRCGDFRFLPASSRDCFYEGWQSDF